MRKAHQTRLHRLAVRQVQTLGEGDHSDGGGLILRVRDDGAGQFLYRFTSPAGKRREMGLGAAHRNNPAHAGQGLTAAREAAAQARAQLQRGLDPIDERVRLKEAAKAMAVERKAQQGRRELTLARAARDYHQRVIEPRLSSKHAAQWISSLENHVPLSIWNKAMEQIEAPELLAALAAVKPHERARNVNGSTLPETLRRIRQRLDAVWEDAIFHKRCTTNPAAAIRRKMREELPSKDAGSFKALDYREAPLLMARLQATQGVSARALEFAVLTASRTSEVLGASWSEFDLQEGVWVVPGARMKAGSPHTVYLSSRARVIVAGQVGLDQRLLFPSPVKRGSYMSNMAMLMTLGRLGVRDRTTAHGLCRATFSTWANDTAAARPDVIEACLAHREVDRIKAAYNRAQFAEERRALMQAWSDHLHRGDGAKIIPFKAA